MAQRGADLGNEDHRVSDVDSLFLITDEEASSNHPAEGKATTKRGDTTFKPCWMSQRRTQQSSVASWMA